VQWTPLVVKTVPCSADRMVSEHIFSYVSETHNRRNVFDLRELKLMRNSLLVLLV
jgi:hypothetical protein